MEILKGRKGMEAKEETILKRGSPERITTGLAAFLLVCFFLVNGWALASEPPFYPEVEGRVVIVAKGDSLWKISRRYFPGSYPPDVIKMIKERNKIGKYIYPGQKILLPAEVPHSKRRVAARPPARSGEQARTLYCEATAYCYTGHRTATGTWPEARKTVAVDPAVIPLNSRIYVTCDSQPSINGIYVAEDTGGLIKGNIIDIYMLSQEEALQWGRRLVKVEILD